MLWIKSSCIKHSYYFKNYCFKIWITITTIQTIIQILQIKNNKNNDIIDETKEINNINDCVNEEIYSGKNISEKNIS